MCFCSDKVYCLSGGDLIEVEFVLVLWVCRVCYEFEELMLFVICCLNIDIVILLVRNLNYFVYLYEFLFFDLLLLLD